MNATITSFSLGLLFAFSFLKSEPASARFLDQDADEIDREELLGTEYFNDEISYRPPLFWHELYRQKDIALRLNAGSYNSTRFMYEENLKLSSSTEKPATFAFRQERQQNLLGNFNEREFRIQLNMLRPFYFSILADADSYKSNADLGAAISYRNPWNGFFEIYVWSVNHLYNQKRYHTKNTVRKPTRTFGARGDLINLKDLRVTAQYEIDTPLTWDRISDGFEYRYFQRKSKLTASFGELNHDWYYAISGSQIDKEESKLWSQGSESSELYKGLQRSELEYEATLNYSKENEFSFTQSIIWIYRDADYQWRAPGELLDAPEEESPDILRNEFDYFVTYYADIPKTENSAYQLGLYLASVNIRESNIDRYQNEVKLQCAWVYRITPTVQSFLNATFNFDGLYDNYPYQNREFKPWDGGALQIIAAF